MKIELDLEKRQLEELLSIIESGMLCDFSGGREPRRGMKLVEAVRAQHPHRNSSVIEALAPVYISLLNHWPSRIHRTGMSMDPDSQMAFGRWVVEQRAIDKVLADATTSAETNGNH